MSEDTSSSNSTPKEKKKEIFGMPQDDVTLYAAAGALGLATLLAGKTVLDMFANGQIPNPFAPQQQRQRVTYVDEDEQQQRYQQEYERAQQLANQQQQQQQQAQLPDGTENPQFGGNSVAASNDIQYQGFDDSEDGVSYSTTVQPPRSAQAGRNTLNYNRINVG